MTMFRASRTFTVCALNALALTLAYQPGQAHKPITSPFTYNDDVFPILKERCSRCHVADGVAPLSLMTYDDTVPWGESILAPITDEVSPRDNRELFNFNLEELRIGQPMLVIDQFSDWGSVSMFFNPRASFNKNPGAWHGLFVRPVSVSK